MNIEFGLHTDHVPRHYGAEIDGIYLEIYPLMQNSKPKDAVGFRVGNLEEAIRRVGEEYLIRPPADSKFGRFALIRDPDNRIVYLTED